jgi:hypothetical protein
VASRVSPTEAIRAQIHELFEAHDDGSLLSVVEQVARLSARLTFQSVLEEIVCEELGRGRCERRPAADPPDVPPAYRSGWQEPRTLKTAPAATQAVSRVRAKAQLIGRRPAVVARVQGRRHWPLSCGRALR